MNGGLFFSPTKAVITRIVSGAASQNHAMHFLRSYNRSRFLDSLFTLNRSPVPCCVLRNHNTARTAESSLASFRAVCTRRVNTIATPTAKLRVDHRLVGQVRVGNVRCTFIALRYNVDTFRAVRIRSLAGRGVSSRHVRIITSRYSVIGHTGLNERGVITINTDIIGTARDSINASALLGPCDK